MTKDPSAILTTSIDFFGDALVIDNMLTQLRAVPESPHFMQMMRACLDAIIKVLWRDSNAKYFALNITDTLRKEVESIYQKKAQSEWPS